MTNRAVAQWQADVFYSLQEDDGKLRSIAAIQK
jgi:hypothetical protein